jgi:hypothetical protein
MSLCIAGLQKEIASAPIVLLSALGGSGTEALVQALAEANDKQVLVLYDPASIAVARGLARSEPPSASLAAWKNQAKTLLSLYRAHRRRLVFASAAAVNAQPKRFRAALTAHFNLTGAIGLITTQPGAPELSAWQLVLASHTLNSDADALLLDRELGAAALPLPGVAGDTDEAFTELEAAASIRAALLRQLGNVRAELREYFLKTTVAETSRADAAAKPNQPDQGKKEPASSGSPAKSDKPAAVAKAAAPPNPTVKRVHMNQLFALEQDNYQHCDISLHDVQDGEMHWSNIRFKFCSWHSHEYLEFRSNPSVPVMFESWPGKTTDKFGDYINYPDPSTGQLVEITGERDRRLVRLIFNVLERVVKDVLNAANLDAAGKSAWHAKASRLAASQRVVMASWDGGGKASA